MSMKHFIKVCIDTMANVNGMQHELKSPFSWKRKWISHGSVRPTFIIDSVQLSLSIWTVAILFPQCAPLYSQLLQLTPKYYYLRMYALLESRAFSNVACFVNYVRTDVLKDGLLSQLMGLGPTRELVRAF